MSDITIGTEGHYERVEKVSRSYINRLKSYTFFIGYDIGGHMTATEEIDVRGEDETDARIICSVALQENYEPGGVILAVRENIPGVTYF